MTRPSPALARRQDAWLALVNRPVSFDLLAPARTMVGIAWLPGIGHMVSDADVARAVLLDGMHVNSHGPGSFGQTVTPVSAGPSRSASWR